MLSSTLGYSQKGSTIFGFQVKPIIPVDYFNAGPVSFNDTIVSITVTPKMGYSFGMVARHNFTNTISFETGINTIRRNFDVQSFENNILTDQTDFGFVSYEIPLQGLIYIRLSEKIFMNVASGIGINWYASDVVSLGENSLIDHYSQRASWMNASFLANVGFEYRTEKKGYFYLGASFVNPFSAITKTNIFYEYEKKLITKLSTKLNGNYLTLDIRWFFPESAEKKKK